MNGGIINSITRLHLVGYFSWVIRFHIAVPAMPKPPHGRLKSCMHLPFHQWMLHDCPSPSLWSGKSTGNDASNYAIFSILLLHLRPKYSLLRPVLPPVTEATQSPVHIKCKSAVFYSYTLMVTFLDTRTVTNIPPIQPTLIYHVSALLIVCIHIKRW
jgi:hypothetical protein